MKKNTLLTCLAFALCASSVSLAQTLQDKEKLQEITTYLKLRY